MIHSGKSVIELAGIKLRLGQHIGPEMLEHLEHGSYELPELAALREKLVPDDVVLELGTGLGFLSAYCAKVVGSKRVFTYEANPELEQSIRDTYALNGVCPVLEMCALGADTGARTLYVSDEFWESSTLPGGRRLRILTVPCRSFEGELARIRPTFLVIDIEGGEYELTRHTRFPGVRKLVIEIHKDLLGAKRARAVRAALYRAGFRAERRLSRWDVMYLERA